MRLDHIFCLLALLSLALPVAVSANAKGQKPMLFGVNYLPQVTCVEDFGPYWRTDNWTEKRVVTDMKIMKAIGCSCIRLPLYPAIPGKLPSNGEPAEKYLPMLDLVVKTAGELGIKVHLDICEDVEIGTNGEEGIRFTMNRYKGRIESYQIGNEAYGWPQSEEQLKWLQGLVELGHSIDPHAKISADILAPDWAKIRKEHPNLYSELNPALAHYYSVTDHRGWNQMYINDLVDYLSNPTGRHSAAMLSYGEKKHLKDFGEYDAKAKSFDHEWYTGSYGWLDKEVWLSEFTAHGYWRWGNLVPEDKRAADLEKVVDAIAEADNHVTRIYHWCFRDKMSNREFGMGQCGIVRYDGEPRPDTWAFKKMAQKYAWRTSPLSALDCEIDRATVTDGAKTVQLRVTLFNKTGKMLKGKCSLDLPDNTTTRDGHFDFSLPAKGERSWKIPVDVSMTHWGANHAFTKVEIPQGLVYGWGVIAKPKPVEINPISPFAPKDAGLVSYPTGVQAVQEFFDKYGDDCAIVIGPGLGNDAEMGSRLKTVMMATRCKGDIPTRSAILSIDVLNRPLIVIGTPEWNMISKTIELALPPEQRVSALSPGKGIVTVVKEPFGEMNVGGRLSRQSEQVGYFFGACPEVLYIAGPDDEGTKAAAYDLIGRIWGTEEKYR